MNSREPYSRSFTLIELLVVVAIIAVLVAILLPGLQAAREQARSTQCKAQLRHVGFGFYYYADMFDDYVPARVTCGGYDGKALWYDILMWGLNNVSPPLFSNGEVKHKGGDTIYTRDRNFICPTAAAKDDWILQGRYGNIIDMTTSYAQTHAISDCFSVADHRAGRSPWGHTFKTRDFVSPETKVMLVDARDWAIDATRYYTSGSTFYQYEVNPLHNGGPNVLYCDWHVGWAEYYDFVDPNDIKKFFPDWP